MKNFKQQLVVAGVMSFTIALFQALIGFSPSLSLYFGAPEVLVKNIQLLIFTSLLISGLIAGFGLYALSGAGHIPRLPWLKQMLTIISAVYIIRGLLIVPESLILLGLFDSSIPVAPRFVGFSLGSLLVGLVHLSGTIGGWSAFAPENKL